MNQLTCVRGGCWLTQKGKIPWISEVRTRLGFDKSMSNIVIGFRSFNSFRQGRTTH